MAERPNGSKSRVRTRAVRGLLVLTLACLIGASGWAVRRDPDSRVDRPGNEDTQISEARNPAVALDGSRVYAVYMDRRYGTQYDPQFNVSVNEGGTWRTGDVRLNTNFVPGFSDGGGMEFVYPAVDPAGNVYVLMQDDTFGTLYAHTSPDEGESWPGNPQKLTLNESNPEQFFFTLRSAIAALAEGHAAVVWADEQENSLEGRGNVRLRITQDAGETWLPDQQVNIADESLPFIGDEERATQPATCGTAADRLYVTWRDKGDPDPDVTGDFPGRILLRYSEDGGQTFLPDGAEIRLDRLDDGDPEAEAARPSVGCLDGGTAAVAWEDQRAGEKQIFVAVTTDGGASWSDEQRIDDAPEGAAARRPQVAVAGSDPVRIHVAWEDARDGFDDIYVTTSEDAGGTWSAPLRLTGSPEAGKTPVEDWDLAAEGDHVVLAWVDDRNGGADFNVRDVFAVRSEDGGLSWSEEQRLDTGTSPGGADSHQLDVAAGETSYVVIYRDFRNELKLSSDRRNSDVFTGGAGMPFDSEDADDDGFLLGRDVCPNYPDPEQLDGDYDGRGDLCDPFPEDGEDDADNDGISSLDDNCPAVANQLQEDSDLDGFGDACDFCPSIPDDVQRDLDGDGLGEPCDDDVDGDGVPDASDGDDDGDGVDDGTDNCRAVRNPLQRDLGDGDGVGDACDLDDEMVQNLVVEPFEDGRRFRAVWENEASADSYHVYFGHVSSLAEGEPGACYRPNRTLPRATVSDAPAAGRAYWYLPVPVTGGAVGQVGFDSGGAPRPAPGVCDDAAAQDWDLDGLENPFDNCPLDANAGQEDRDGDGAGDACDPYPGDPEDDARDRDGVGADVDNCPLTENPEQADADGDGVGDACDVCPATADPQQRDGDNDGVGDACEPDLDGDGIPNDADEDIDGDGVANSEDNCDKVANADQRDLADGDGVGDACDTDDGEIGPLRFDAGSKVTLIWPEEAGADKYSVYRDDVADLDGVSYGNCLLPGQPIRFADVPDVPVAGSSFYYLVTGVFDGAEGTAGFDSSGQERQTPDGCQ
jgi:hypothetical protein